jgi:hypothetical protein
MSTALQLRILASLAAVLFAAVASFADVPEFPGPEPEHAFLKRFTGEWTSTSEAKGAPDQPALTSHGTLRCRMLGEFWVVCDAEMSGGGMQIKAVQTIGYDPAKKKYVGTWVDSMMNHLWTYEGTVKGNTLTLEAEGPNCMDGGKLTKMRDIYEFKSETEIAVSSQAQNDAGEWVTFMTGVSKRNP